MKRSVPALVLATLLVLGLPGPALADPLPPLPAATASYRSGSLLVDVYGTPGKPALILVPGLACGPWVWSGVIARFAPDYTIYALTLPGFDGRPAIAAASLFGSFSADFWSLLADEKIASPVVIGHSLGGTLGFLLAEQHPKRLRALIAVDGLPILPGFDFIPPAQRQQIAKQSSSGLAMLTPEQFARAQTAQILPGMIADATAIPQAAALVAKSDPKATGRWIAEDMTTDLRPDLRKIAIPVLEIAPFDATVDTPASRGQLKTADDKKAYYEHLLQGTPNARVEMITSSRHFVMIDQPQALGGDIAAFLSPP